MQTQLHMAHNAKAPNVDNASIVKRSDCHQKSNVRLTSVIPLLCILEKQKHIIISFSMEMLILKQSGLLPSAVQPDI